MKVTSPSETAVEIAIVEAADRLLARFGYRKMTIEDLAREVGIGKGSVYLHFRSKKDIALATIDRIVDAVCTALVAERERDAPAARRLARMLEVRVMVRLDAVRDYTESIDSLLADLRTELLQRRRGYFRREARILAALLDEGVAAGDFDCDDTESVASSLVTATNDLLPASLSAKELGRRARVLARIRSLAALLVRGVERRRNE